MDNRQEEEILKLYYQNTDLHMDQLSKKST